MRRTVIVALIFILLLTSMPPVRGQVGTLTPSGSIRVVAGDYSSGTMYLTNDGMMAYSVVSYQSFVVLDSQGKSVEGFNFTISPRAFSTWRSGDKKEITYNLSCSSNVPPGNYTLRLRFLATTPTGSIVILTSNIPVEVLGSPIVFKSAETYVPGRGSYSFAYVGEKVVVYSHIINIGHKILTVNASVELYSPVGRVHFSQKSVEVAPGDTLVKFTVPIGLDYRTGTYRLVYTLHYGDEEYRFVKNFTVLVGVKLVGISIQSESVKFKEPNRAYVTILSERNATIKLLAFFRADNKTVGTFSKTVSLSPGTEIIEVPLPTNSSGEITALFKLLLGDRTIGMKKLKYTVVAPPQISSVVANSTGDELVLEVSVYNPGNPVQGTVSYLVWLNGTMLYNDTIVQVFPGGNSTISLMLRLPGPGEVKYFVSISAGGASSSVNGTLTVVSPILTTSTTSTSSSPVSSSTNTTPTTGEANGGGFPWWPVVGILIVVAVAIVLYYQNQPKKRRTRKAPKRRSPLGRFKRPKPPKFHERDSLPKKK